ncbi:MAG: DUF1150 family protein [Pseudomonadota bacterium]|nr:DUF1150 family protein [Pseudomonadota bacterium]
MNDAMDPIRKISPEELGQLGLPLIAYVKAVELPEGQRAFGIFSAAGKQVGVAPTRETAIIAVRQHEMQPVSVH